MLSRPSRHIDEPGPYDGDLVHGEGRYADTDDTFLDDAADLSDDELGVEDTQCPADVPGETDFPAHPKEMARNDLDESVPQGEPPEPCPSARQSAVKSGPTQESRPSEMSHVAGAGEGTLAGFAAYVQSPEDVPDGPSVSSVSLETSSEGVAERWGASEKTEKRKRIGVLAVGFLVWCIGMGFFLENALWSDNEVREAGEVASAGKDPFDRGSFQQEKKLTTNEDIERAFREAQVDGREPWEVGGVAPHPAATDSIPDPNVLENGSVSERSSRRKERGHGSVKISRKTLPTALESEPVSELDRELGNYFGVGGAVGGELSKGSKDLDVPVGTRIPVWIGVGITSAKHGRVIARAAKDVKKNGEIVVPKGAIFVGRSSSDDKRVYVDFTQMRAGKQAVKIGGHAISGNLPGLAPAVIKQPLSERQAKRARTGAAVGAKNAVADAVGLISGQAGEAVRGIGDGVVEEERLEGLDRNATLIIKANTNFEVLVTE